MDTKIRNEIVEQYMPLVTRVVMDRFQFVFSHPSSSISLTIEDLQQIGYMALLRAVPAYKETRADGSKSPATLKTFLYRAISNALQDAVDKNRTPITVGSNIARVRRTGSPETNKALTKALQFMWLSEFEGAQEWMAMVNRSVEEPSHEEAVDEREWIDACCTLILEKLGSEMFEALIHMANGEGAAALAYKWQVSRPRALARCSRARREARALLQDAGLACRVCGRPTYKGADCCCGEKARNVCWMNRGRRKLPERVLKKKRQKPRKQSRRKG